MRATEVWRQQQQKQWESYNDLNFGIFDPFGLNSLDPDQDLLFSQDSHEKQIQKYQWDFPD